MKDLISRMSEAASKATPGEWRWSGGLLLSPKTDMVLYPNIYEEISGKEQDMDFIALCNPANVLKLLEAHKEMAHVLDVIWFKQPPCSPVDDCCCDQCEARRCLTRVSERLVE